MLFRPSARAVATVLASAALSLTLAAAMATSGAAVPQQNGSDRADRNMARGSDAERLAALLPNMTPLRATDIYVTGSGRSRQLRFQTSLANVGRGPLEVRPNRALPCPGNQRGASQVIYRDVDGNGSFRRDVDTRFTRRKAGCMVFHPTHNHWHFEASSFYSLRPAGDGPDHVAAYRKTSFCFRDSERVPARMGTFNRPPYYGACSSDRPMGVNIGWTDVYQSFLDGQSLNLGDRNKVPNGRYCLGIRVDPKDAMRESDETDNVALRALRIRGDSVTALPNNVCS